MSALEEARKQWAPWRGDIWRFPKAPCNWLCERKDIKRFHFTCLTCPIRRLHFKKRGSENLTKYKQIIWILESATGKGFVMPKRYKTYGLVLRQGLPVWRQFIIKMLMTAAERVAEW